jgi:hypothetical protein
MDLTNKVAKCRHCHTLLDLGQVVTPAGIGRDRPRPKALAPVALPSGLKVDDSGQGLKIARRWFSFVFIIPAFLCVLLDGVIVFWYSMSFRYLGYVSLSFVVATSPFWAIGICLTYYTLAGFLNHTTVSVEGKMLRARHGPLPWFGSRALQTASLDQLFTEKKRHQGRVTLQEMTSPDVAEKKDLGVYYSYNVCAVTTDGRKVVLISGLPRRDQALFIEQRVETYLEQEKRAGKGNVVVT